MERQNGQKMKRRPIRRQMQRMMLTLCVAALVLMGVLLGGSMTALRDTVLRDSQDLGSGAAATSGAALLDQMESSIFESVQDKAALVDGKLERFAGYVRDFAFYAGRLYEEPEAYVPKEVLPPDAVNKYQYVLQLSRRDESVDRAAILDEVGLLANLVHEWQPVMTNNAGNIASIYLCTESGFMINYDERSDLTDELFDYSGSSWYNLARDAGEAVYTAPYMDTFGRGLIVTCAAPFYDAEGGFAGVMSMDILVEDLCRSVLDVGFGQGSYAFLVDEAGDIIVSPNMREDGTFDNVLDPYCTAYEAAEGIMSGAAGVMATSYGIYYAYAPVAAADWMLVLHVPAGMVTDPADDIRKDITAKTGATAEDMDRSILRAELISLAVFVLIVGAAAALSGGFSRRLTGPLMELTRFTKTVTAFSQNTGQRVQLKTGDEIEELGDAFNYMLEELEDYIKNLSRVTAEKERIGAELDIATHIQASMLPCIFPPFPERREFEIYATMDPAKEVGGDFYDFFLVDDTHLAIVVADVSGKGVPAALFMVIGKTLIKDHTTPGRDLGEVFMEVNRLLCEGNAEEMFITAFEGVLDLETGQFNFVNAGHETPFLCKAGGRYAPQKVRPGFVLAGMEGTRYRMGTMTLEPGDKLFQYTDGVTEATNGQSELYGMERLEAALNAHVGAAPDQLLPAVRADINAFVGDAPQFDDITMLCLEYRERMKTKAPEEGAAEAAGEP